MEKAEQMEADLLQGELDAELAALEAELQREEEEIKEREDQVMNKEVMCQVYSEKPWVTVFLKSDTEKTELVSLPKSEVYLDGATYKLSKVIDSETMDDYAEYVWKYSKQLIDPLCGLAFKNQVHQAKSANVNIRPQKKQKHVLTRSVVLILIEEGDSLADTSALI